MEAKELLARNVAWLCARNELSISELAEKSGVDRMTLSTIIRCKHKRGPHGAIIEDIANTFGVTVTELETVDMKEVLPIEEKLTCQNVWSNIDEYCRQNGLSYGSFAKKAGVHRDTIYRAKKHNTSFRETTLAKIAEALNMSVDELKSCKAEEPCIGEQKDIRTLCQERGISLTQLAEEANISNPTVQNALKGNVTEFTYGKIAKALNVRLEELLIPPKG